MDIFQKKTYILGCRKGNKLKNKLPKKKSRAFKCPVPAYMLSHFSRVRFFATPWTVARQAPLSVEFSRQECWSGLPFLPPGHLPDPGIKPAAPEIPALQVDSLLLEPSGNPHDNVCLLPKHWKCIYFLKI